MAVRVWVLCTAGLDRLFGLFRVCSGCPMFWPAVHVDHQVFMGARLSTGSF